MAEEDYDQRVEVLYDATCCEEVRSVIARQIPRTRLEEQLIIKCPLHGTEYSVTRHADGTFTVKPLREGN